MDDIASKLSQDITAANSDESHLFDNGHTDGQMKIILVTIDSNGTITSKYERNSGSKEDNESDPDVNAESSIKPSTTTSGNGHNSDSQEDPLSIKDDIVICLDVDAENEMGDVQLPTNSSTKQQSQLPCYKKPDEDLNSSISTNKRRIFHHKPKDRYPNYCVDMSDDSENEMEAQLKDDTDKSSIMQTETGDYINIANASSKKLVNFISEGPKNAKMVTINKITIKRCDMETLLNWNWLNDQIINAYMALIVERNKTVPKLPSIFAMDTFFVQQLKLSRNVSLENINIFEIDLLLVPVNLMEQHWALITIDMKLDTINYYDSWLGNPIKDTILLITRYLQKQQRKFGYKHKKFKTLRQTTPQQLNTWDCGVYMCLFADLASRRTPIRFSKRTFCAYRTKMLRSILLKKLSIN